MSYLTYVLMNLYILLEVSFLLKALSALGKVCFAIFGMHLQFGFSYPLMLKVKVFSLVMSSVMYFKLSNCMRLKRNSKFGWPVVWRTMWSSCSNFVSYSETARPAFSVAIAVLDEIFLVFFVWLLFKLTVLHAVVCQVFTMQSTTNTS